MSKLTFVGTCVNSFDGDGECIINELPYSDVTDFAIALEDASEIGSYEFHNQVEYPSDLVLTGESFTYLEVDNVLIAYDEEADIHYLFAK